MPGFQESRADEPLLPVEEALGRVLAEVDAGGAEEVTLADAIGRVLAERVFAIADAPAADNSGMDGYALRTDDVASATAEEPVRLRVAGDVPAGHVPEIRVETGTAVRIMTGAYVPDGADAVVKVELTDAGVDQVRVFKAVKRGANIRRRGEDMRQGEVVVHAGVRIDPAVVAMLAANRKSRVSVARRPTVAIVATGDELAGVDEAPQPGKIVNTNSWLIAALVREAGALAVPLGIVPDDREATIAALERAAQSDVVITTGGVSVGAFDFVKDALDALGAETKFWRVAMKPGKPVVLSRLRGRLAFGLPGNPVSCFVSFHLFVAPALRKMLGMRELLAPVVPVRLATPLAGDRERRVYYRARASWRDGVFTAEPLRTQGSGSLTSMLGANALVIVEAGASAPAGSAQQAMLIG